MSKIDLRSKIAVDKNGEKLGRIIEVREFFDYSKKKNIVQIVILKKVFLKKDIHVVFDQKIITQFKDNKVWLDILKHDYDEHIEKVKALRKHMVNNADLRDASNNEKAYAKAFAWGKI